jgi:hypothetical protein
VLEFEVPRSGGRRPDLIVLENGIVLVVEFKNRVAAEAADIDQVLGYAQELADYHAGCRDRQLVPVLVPIGLDREPSERRGVHVVPPRGLGALIRKLAKSTRRCPRVGRRALCALPALTQAARLLFVPVRTTFSLDTFRGTDPRVPAGIRGHVASAAS